MKAIKYPLSLVYFMFSIFLVSSVSYSSESYSLDSYSSHSQSSDSHSEETTDSSAPSPATEDAEKSLSEQIRAIDQEAGSAGWKVRNGCVPSNRIKRIKFIDDKTALITMYGKKTAILRLERECPGIKRSGYVTYRTNNRLCAHFDRLSVMGGSGYSCRIASIEPFVAFEEPVLEKDID